MKKLELEVNSACAISSVVDVWHANRMIYQNNWIIEMNGGKWDSFGWRVWAASVRISFSHIQIVAFVGEIPEATNALKKFACSSTFFTTFSSLIKEVKNSSLWC